MKKILSCLVVICLLSVSIAHAEVPALIPGYWGPVTVNQDDYLFSLHLKVRIDNLTDDWANAAARATNRWTDYSENYVVAEVVDSGYNVECASKISWFWFLPDDTIAITNIRDSGGIWAWNFSNGAGNSSNMNTNLEYAHIYVNEDNSCDLGTYSSKQKRAIMGHEMGHVLNLGHYTTTSTPSIMYHEIASVTEWSHIDRPQHQDRLNLIYMYRTHLNRGV